MPITVCIERDDQGQFKVGIEPENEAEGAADDDSYLKPVADLNAALSTAKDLLSGSTGAQAQDAQAEGDFTKGFAGVRPMGASGPGMPGA